MLAILLVYWQIKSVYWRNLFLLAASYFFYGYWDYRFLSLVVLSSTADFIIGQKIDRSQQESRRKRYLWISLGVNLGVLGFFKYFNFFTESFAQLFRTIGWEIDALTLSIVLPVGISFYTFQTLSYTIDIYRRRISSTSDPIKFFAFVSFFPQLVAGPIERAESLLPQFNQIKRIRPELFVEGFRQILWGLFKKIVIADQCGVLVNEIFSNSADYSSFTLAIGAILFAFQIYGDFSGYSDIAIGTARLLGFKLRQNFAYPYFARNVAEFWRRWHISLTTWFRDYVYIPLGGSRVESRWLLLRNVFIVFLLSGFWHGANWTFIVWGGLNALFFIPLLLSNLNRKYIDPISNTKRWPGLSNLLRMLFTFALITTSWVFFRADNLSHALAYWQGLSRLDVAVFELGYSNMLLLIAVGMNLLLLISFEWTFRQREYPFEKSKCSIFLRWSYYLLIGFLIVVFAGENSDQFIYFQF